MLNQRYLKHYLFSFKPILLVGLTKLNYELSGYRHHW